MPDVWDALAPKGAKVRVVTRDGERDLAVVVPPPVPEPGIEVVLPRIVREVVASLPVPKDGIDGKSLDTESVVGAIVSATQTILAALPAPQDGRDGIDGRDGRDGKDGKDAREVRRWRYDIVRDGTGLIDHVIATAQ